MSEPMRMSAERRISPGRKASAAGVAFALTLSAGVQLTGLAGSSNASLVPSIGIDAGGSSTFTTKSGEAFASDRHHVGGTLYTASSSVAIAATEDDALYRTTRYGLSSYRIPVPAAGVYGVAVHMVELQTGGRGKRVFDIAAEGSRFVNDLDLYKHHGRYVAVVKTTQVSVTDGTLDLSFAASTSLGPTVSAVQVSPVAPAPTVTSTPAPTATATTAPTTQPTAPASTPTAAATPTTAPIIPTSEPTAPVTSEFPTIASTGPRVATSQLTPSGSITSSYDGQVIERKDVTGVIRIRHNNVVVRDTRVSFTSNYGLQVVKRSDGTCPVGARYEFVEVDGRLADEADVPVYASGCQWTLDHAHVHNVGRAVKLTHNNTVSNSYIFSSRTGDSGVHRGAVGLNGGRNNKVINNVLMCEGTGCSAAIPMYGDFSPVDGMLVQHNLLATTGSYCSYGGSLSGKAYPEGSNIKFIDNHFSTRFHSKCGRYGAVSGFANGVRGNEARGNVWHESGLPLNLG